MVGYQKGAKSFITSTYTHGSSGTKETVNKRSPANLFLSMMKAVISVSTS